MLYKVVCMHELVGLQQAVTSEMENGWLPTGGPVWHDEYQVWAQAIYRTQVASSAPLKGGKK